MIPFANKIKRLNKKKDTLNKIKQVNIKKDT